MEPLGFGKMSQTTFEKLVREVWRAGERGDAYLYTIDIAKSLTVIALAAHCQPELLEGRAAHNLGHMKMEWLRDLLARETRPRSESLADFGGGK